MESKTTAPEPTLESVQAELAAEQAAHMATKEQLATEHSARLAYMSDLEKTQSELAIQQKNSADAAAALSEATGIITGQAETIKAQEAQIVELQANPSEFPTVSVSKVTYEVHAKNFKFKGVDYTVEDLLKNKTLQKELVEKGVGFLVKKEVA